MGFKTTALITTASVLCVSAPAFAANFAFESNNLGGNTTAGYNQSIKTIFNDENDVFKWSATFKEKDGALAEGAWLVVNAGDNPKKSPDKLAIFYIDGGADKKVSIFEYNGGNNADSFVDKTYLGSTTLDVLDNNDERTFSFKMDMTDINGRTDLGPNWKGAQFDGSIGIWHHGVTGLETEYDANGKLTDFAFKAHGWKDIDNHPTSVPEPAATAALGLFAAAGAFLKRSKQSA